MALGGMKPDFTPSDFQNSAAATMRWHNDGIANIRRDASPRQRRSHRIALGGAIGIGRQVLQQTAAAGSEMPAD
jgi:hypothetical protein